MRLIPQIFLLQYARIYQNTTAMSVEDPIEIKKNLIAQLTSPVMWTQTINAMVKSGITDFFEGGTRKSFTGFN